MMQQAVALSFLRPSSVEEGGERRDQSMGADKPTRYAREDGTNFKYFIIIENVIKIWTQFLFLIIFYLASL